MYIRLATHFGINYPWVVSLNSSDLANCEGHLLKGGLVMFSGSVVTGGC